jgi:hypothetical protein
MRSVEYLIDVLPMIYLFIVLSTALQPNEGIKTKESAQKETRFRI